MGYLFMVQFCILVRKGPFMDQEFGHEYLGLFGDTFRQVIISCESQSTNLQIKSVGMVFYAWFSIWCKFLLRGVSECILVFVIYQLFIAQLFITAIIKISQQSCRGVQFWWSCTLITYHFIAFRDCFLWKSVLLQWLAFVFA